MIEPLKVIMRKERKKDRLSAITYKNIAVIYQWMYTS